MRTCRRLLFASLVAAVAGVTACGSRTGLLVPVDESPTDASVDVHHPDAARDATEEDVVEDDGLPGIDVAPPKVPNDCPDAASTLIYVIGEDNNLYSFYPPEAAFTLIGTIACPVVTPGDEPFSMAVDRNGIAYVVFSNQTPGNGGLGGELFRVSTATAACEPTPYVIDQSPDFHTFGMGFSGNADGTGETLYVAGDPVALGSTPSQLGSLDTTTYKLTVLGTFDPPITGGELTGTGAGDLFTFYATTDGSAIGQIDKTTAAIVGQSDLPGVDQGEGWAFAFWGGDFYTFTAASGNSVVTRYRPADGTIVQVAQAGSVIVGAGVSTCAPQQ
jgi:hypothetical protein